VGPERETNFSSTGHALTTSIKHDRLQRLNKATRLRLKRRQALWFGLKWGVSEIADGSICAEVGSLIPDSRIQQDIDGIDHEVQDDQQKGVEHHQAYDQGIIPIE